MFLGEPKFVNFSTAEHIVSTQLKFTIGKNKKKFTIGNIVIII